MWLEVAVFRIKICGVTRVADARLAEEGGADAIGLNFYAASPRCLDADQARRLASTVGHHVCRVGVFVDADPDHVRRLADQFHLDWIQLHGNEPPEALAAFAGRNLIKSFRLEQEGTAAIANYLERCRDRGVLPAAVLIDGHAPGHYGGTGQPADWPALRPPRPWLLGRPLILAGGLRPDNVQRAVRDVEPAAVDVASGVESSPGIKDPAQLARFIANAKSAWPAGGNAPR